MEKYLFNSIAFFVYFFYTIIFISLPHSIFRDRENYEAYVNYLSNILYNYNVEGLSIFFNEPIFLLINYILGSIFSSATVVYIFVFTIITSFFIFLKKKSANLLMFILGVIAFFSISYSFHFQFVILRQALATTLILGALLYCKDFKKLLIICSISCFIHSSMFLILFLLVLNNVLKNKEPLIRYGFISIIIFIFGFFALKVAIFLGIRQAGYLLELDYSVGGGAFLLWFLVLISLLFFYKEKSSFLYEYSVLGLLFFLILYFFNPIVGRLMCSFVPAIILLLVSRFNFTNFIILLTLIIVYCFLIESGVLVENSLAVDADSFFKSLRNSYILKEF